MGFGYGRPDIRMKWLILKIKLQTKITKHTPCKKDKHLRKISFLSLILCLQASVAFCINTQLHSKHEKTAQAQNKEHFKKWLMNVSQKCLCSKRQATWR